MGFSPNDIAYFLEIARQEHIGRAAQEAGVTQPAMTKALRRLEDAVGVPLFERGGHGVRLTPNGQLFLESARRFHLEHAGMLRAASELRAQHAGLLRVGLTNPHGESDVVRALADMVRARPGLRLALKIDRSDTLNAAVEAGELDLAVVPSYPGHSFSCTQLVLNDDKVYAACRAQHPLLSVARPTLQDLLPYSWIMAKRNSAARRLIDDIFETAGLPVPSVTLEVEFTSEAVMGMIAGTDLLSMVPATVLRSWMGRVMPLPIPLLTVQRSLVLLTRPQAGWPPLVTAFRDALLLYRTNRDALPPPMPSA
jgi:DNA-binding transcriptional LysR family regulator